jgi:hypothetical protein
MCYCNHKEYYQNNDINSENPDDKIFMSCSHKRFEYDTDYKFEKYPDSNYKIKKHEISKPLKGPFTAFLDITDLKTYDNFYEAPICEDTYPFDDNDFRLQFREIINSEDDSKLLTDIEKLRDSKDIKNPNYLYGNPEYIGNKILYNKENQIRFLRKKLQMDKHHEDSEHIKDDHYNRYNL